MAVKEGFTFALPIIPEYPEQATLSAKVWGFQHVGHSECQAAVLAAGAVERVIVADMWCGGFPLQG